MSGLDTASIVFILFGLAVALVINLSRAPRWRFGVLLGASVIFLLGIEHDIARYAPLAGFLAVGYIAIVAVRRGVPHATVCAVVLLIGAYAWLKQYSILPRESFLAFPYVTLGLSYIFFRVLHLVVDAELPGAARETGPAHYLGYTLNFTTFNSGPIQRFGDFRQQIDAPLDRPDMGTVGRAIERILVGFFKVNIAALVFNMVRLDAFAVLAQPGMGQAKLLAALELVGVYPFFLYCNFSGYIDIVIALARLMGLVLPENFNRPFSATSMIDFWNRWHITLSTWLKTYVYNPLLMALLRRFTSPRIEQACGVLCFFVTFFLVGLWHGRTSEFIVFGLLQGGGVAINKLWQVIMAARLGRKPYRALAARPLYAIVSRGLTFAWFAFTLMWFWSTWDQLHVAYSGAGPIVWAEALLALWVLASILLALWEKAREVILSVTVKGEPLVRHPYARTVFVTVLAAIALVAVGIRSQPAPGIVYRTF